MHKFYGSDTGYADVEFRNDGVLTDPDQDVTFYVEMYDADDVLQGTYTLSTTPAITQIVTGAFKIEDFALSAYAEGVPYAKWYAKISGVAIEPYPYIDYWGQILEDPTGYNLCSLDDLKTHLEIVGSDQDTYLGKLVLRATQFIETYC
ncbi:phage head-tail connector protein, partial [bacterium]|nr:phage head-tail connector protein [bacterium]